MTSKKSLQVIGRELESGIQLTKCQRCGCMADTLQQLASSLSAIGTNETQLLTQRIDVWQRQMQPIRYGCLGCEHCYPAVAQNHFASAFPSANLTSGLSCEFRTRSEWPPVVGEYFVVDEAAPVAVSTLASVKLAQELAKLNPKGLAIVGKTETENIGIDKIVKNTITNPAIGYLIVAGKEPKGHQAGKTLLALIENGIDAKGRVIGSRGKRPFLRNVCPEEIAAFRQQVQAVDMIGCNDLLEIVTRIEELSQKGT